MEKFSPTIIIHNLSRKFIRKISDELYAEINKYIMQAPLGRRQLLPSVPRLLSRKLYQLNNEKFKRLHTKTI